MIGVEIHTYTNIKHVESYNKCILTVYFIILGSRGLMIRELDS